MKYAFVIFVLVLCVGVLSQLAVGQRKTVSFSPSSEVIQNPERGLYQLEETGMVRGQITPYDKLDPVRLRTIRQSYSLVFRYFGLKKWRTVDLPQSVLQSIGADFAAVRAAGLKCIPRFSYSADIGEPDAAPGTILRHLDQLKPVLQANKDVIAFMQAGFIGAWGEWHSSTNGNDSLHNMRNILHKLLAVISPDRMIQIRNPRQKQEIFSLPFDSTASIPLQQAFTGSPVSRVGHHNDCFLASADDYGTYWRNNRIDTALAKPYLRLDTRYVPMGGETCALSSFSNCANALKEMARLRWSYMNAGYNESVINGFISGGCYDELKRKLGYRFSLLNSTFTAFGQKGGKLSFGFRIVNSGWASLYNPRIVELCLRKKNDGRVFSVELPVDPRMWGAGDTVNVNVAVGIPATIPAGAYSLLLNFPDPEPGLRKRPDYSIRLANQNMWEPATGYNKLVDSITIGASPSSDLYSGTLWLHGETINHETPSKSR